MTVLVNGKANTQAPANDRGLLYGQSVFETISVVNGKPSLIEQHYTRLEDGCIKLYIPFNINDLKNDIDVISTKIRAQSNAVLRITVTMGQGGRGYLNPSSPQATRIVSLHDYPDYSKLDTTSGITLGLSVVQLSHQPLLAGIKHGNRLEQILARSQWQDGWHEALLCDQQDQVIEGTQSNVIIIKGTQAITPKLDQCGVNGVMKNWLLSQLKNAGFSCHAVRLSLQDIKEADEVLMTNSIIGVWPVKQFHNNAETYTYSDFSTADRLLELLYKNEIIPDH